MRALFVGISVLLLGGPAAFADLASMQARIGKLVELKNKGLVGEKRDGLVGVVKSGDGAEAVVAAENKDRTEIYEQRARAGGVSLPTFMKIMGDERIKNEPAGRFIQTESGSWVKK